MNLLFVTPDLNHLASAGGHIRKWNMLQALLSVGEVDVLACACDDPMKSENAYRGCRRVFRIPSDVFKTTERQRQLYQSSIGRAKLAFCSSFPSSYLWGDMTAARHHLRESFSPAEYSLIWVETLRLGAFLGIPQLAAGRPIILDGDDFDWVRDLGVLKSTPAYGAKIFDYLDLIKMWYRERTCIRHYSYVVRCSSGDRRRQGGGNAVIIPNGTDLPDSVQRRPDSRVLFVGNLAYPPNRIGVEWLLSKIWPQIRERVPHARLDIVGAGASQQIIAASGKFGVSVHGFVENLDALYEQAAFSVVPLLAGGGTRLKILEALGRSVPVVSTSIGAYGIPMTQQHGLVRADGADTFAATCVELLEKSEHGIQGAARQGREAVRGEFEWRSIRSLVQKLAHDCMRNAPTPPQRSRLNGGK